MPNGALRGEGCRSGRPTAFAASSVRRHQTLEGPWHCPCQPLPHESTRAAAPPSPARLQVPTSSLWHHSASPCPCGGPCSCTTSANPSSDANIKAVAPSCFALSLSAPASQKSSDRFETPTSRPWHHPGTPYPHRPSASQSSSVTSRCPPADARIKEGHWLRRHRRCHFRKHTTSAHAELGGEIQCLAKSSLYAAFGELYQSILFATLHRT